MARKKSTIKGAKTKKVVKGAKKEVLQTHGKVEETVPTTLDQVWGDNGQSKYGTFNEKEYKDKISGMTRSDIQTHATKLGVVPVANREMLEKRLVKEFQKHKNLYNAPAQAADNTRLSQASKDILAEGR